MNQNNQQVMAEKIRNRYTEKESTGLDELREMDMKVKRPVNIFSYVFGSMSAIIMGGGMSLIMTDIGTTLGMSETFLPGIVIGAAGLVMALLNYPMHRAMMNSRRKKYASDILALSDKIINQ